MVSPLDFAFDIPQSRDGRIYRVVRDPVLTCVVQFRKGDGTWSSLFSFDTAPQLAVDFEYAHWWCQTHPDSSFLSGLWVYRLLADGGAVSVSREVAPGRADSGEREIVFARFDGRGGVERRVLRDDAALRETLAAEFGIVEAKGQGNEGGKDGMQRADEGAGGETGRRGL